MYSTRFEKAMPDVWIQEGGLNDVKEDKGGITNWGISILFLKSIKLSDGDINNDGIIDWLDIKSMTKEDAKELYFENFWKPFYDTMPSERVAIKIFNTAINCGHPRAHKILQEALVLISGNKMAIDGIIGKETKSLLANYSTGENVVLSAYSACQLKFYQDIVRQDPTQQKFLKGWTNRAKWLPK